QNDIEMKLLADIDISENEVYSHYVSNITDYVMDEKVSIELVNLDKSEELSITSTLAKLEQGSTAKQLSSQKNMPNLMRNADNQRLSMVFDSNIAKKLLSEAQTGELNQWKKGFSSRNGYHLYRLSNYQEAHPIPFEHVQQNVAQQILMTELRKSYNERIAEKKRAYNITIDLQQDNNHAS
ncbi:peptidylprolyl isomerase, partial [Vibrio sp. FNV 38]|nr:peptidylprolyl isomerase [Vibrio sp. FNV 38]